MVDVGKGRERALAHQFETDPTVRFAELNHIGAATSACPGPPDCIVPSDPLFGQQWSLFQTDAGFGWSVTKGSSSTKIAILDTGVNPLHEDLSGKLVADSANFTSSPTNTDLVFGHGTHVAGIAAASTDNAKGIAGVGFNASLMNVKVIDDQDHSDSFASASGIDWARAHGASVINMSYRFFDFSQLEQDAINAAWNQGVVLVAAAGNDHVGTPPYPAGYSNVISAAATDQSDQRASFSDYGTWVSLAAPGVGIKSTVTPTSQFGAGCLGAFYCDADGTSMAAPQVAGTAALLESVVTDTNGDGRTNDEIRGRLESTADPVAGTGVYWSHGRLNIYKAVLGLESNCGEVGASPYAGAVMRDKPIGYWRLCSTAGPWPDSTQSGMTLYDPVCCPGPTGGQAGALVNENNTAAHFGGELRPANSDSTRPPYTPLQFAQGGPFTLEMWFKPDQSLGSSTSGWVHPLIDNQFRYAMGWAGTGASLQNQEQVGANGWAFTIWTSSATAVRLRTTSPISAGTWYHVVAVYDGSASLLYVNGVLAGRQTVGTVSPYANGNPFRIGYEGVDNVATAAGVGDEPAVYDHALSASRVLAHYHAAGY